MSTHRFPTDEELGRAVAEEICSLLTDKPDALLCIAAGTTSFPIFSALLERMRNGAVSFARASFIGMDEWLSLPMDADGAMAAFLRHHFLDEAGFSETFLFDGMRSPDRLIFEAEAFIAAHGGIDLIVFGIGVNGHVALNEPNCDPNARTHVADIASVTAAVAQKYFEKAAPPLQKGITLGLANAREAKRILLTANTPQKRDAVTKILAALEKGQADASLPAALLALCGQSDLLLTDAVGA